MGNVDRCYRCLWGGRINVINGNNEINGQQTPVILSQFEKEMIDTGRKSTQKGANGEREVMAILREHGYRIERGGTQSYGQRPDLYGLDGVHLEIKRSECARIWDWMEQSIEDSRRFEDGVPTVIFRRNRSDWLICMGLEDWLGIYKARCQCRRSETGYSGPLEGGCNIGQHGESENNP